MTTDTDKTAQERVRHSGELSNWAETREWEREAHVPIGLFSGPHPSRRKEVRRG